ncbi:MAG: aldo/keto reductase [Candidatus Omnitrophica bacterium]|nr:aldo/keto reductase [Candidatus Omnitrophota bacterium]
MDYRRIRNIDLPISPLCLGTWAFGGDSWWGKQEDKDSVAVLDAVIKEGITIIDTAPVYGRGRSERIIGDYLKKRKIRNKVVLATKLGLSWEGAKILHNLTKKRMLEEVDESRKRLGTDYFDLYQVHWIDPDTSIKDTAEVMFGFLKKGITKAVGVSNFSLKELKDFIKYCPLHCLQPQYSMFVRDIEEEMILFCRENDIAIISYAPLYSGLLTGKFFFDKVKVPDDTNRKLKKKDLQEPRFSINKDILKQLREIASKYNKTLTQLVINWNFSQEGITSAIVGMRNISQVKDNLGSLGWNISSADLQKIDEILQERLVKIKAVKDS